MVALEALVIERSHVRFQLPASLSSFYLITKGLPGQSLTVLKEI